MRIRQVKQDFWTDELMARLPDSVRLFYIGTWQLADDAGWLVWNVAEIGLHLYGYSPRGRREQWVTERGQALVDVGRLVIEDCGHAYVPNLTKHQKLAGATRRVLTVQTDHSRCSPPIPADPRTSPRIPAPVRKGKEKVGNGMEKVEVPGKSNFEDAVARAAARAQRSAA